METPPSQESRDHVPHVIMPPDTSTRSSSTQSFPKYRSIPTVNQDLTYHSRYRNLLRQIGAIRGTLISSTSVADDESYGRGNHDNHEESPPLTKEQIKGHIYALKSLVKAHNKNNAIDPIRLNFDGEYTEVRGNRIVKGKAVVDDDLKKPFDRY
ncbi:hypothetical protein Tco_0348918 [Tanacetum coccineum]